jgi:xanthine dehydrogenase accessory factor
MKSIYFQIFEHHAGLGLPVLATVVRTIGSAPQVPGSSALFGEHGLIAGTIGGGVVEKRIQELSAERFRNRKSGYFEFNLANDVSRKEEAICGGEITVLLDADADRHLDVFNRLKKSLSEKEHGILMTKVVLRNDNDVDVERFWVSGSSDQPFPISLPEKAESVVKEMLLQADASQYREIDLTSDMGISSFLFFEPVFPPFRLVIAGAGHIGRALAHLGKLTGFEVTVVDDRQEFANRENIPDADKIITGEAGKVFREIEKGPDIYIVIVTRGHKDDAEVLKACIGTSPGYLGMIGSRKKTEAMREEFISNGWATVKQWDALYTPVGIEINSRTVEEIAISIIAQLIKVKNGSKNKLKGCPA